MPYTKSTDFLHLPQYSEMDVLNVLSDFNKAMYNIDVGVSTIHMIVNNVLLSGNLTQEEVEKVKKQIADLSSKTETLETSLNTLKTTVETNENNTTSELAKLHNEILASNTALEKTIDENRQWLIEQDNAIKKDVESVENNIAILTEKERTLETTLNALSSNLEQFENSTNTNLENMNSAILKCATEQQLTERFNYLMAENSALRSNLETVEELGNDNNTKIQTLTGYVPNFVHTTNVSFTVNTASQNHITNPDIKIETTTYGVYSKHDIYFSFDYATTQEIGQNMELGFADITPIHDLLFNNDFIGRCEVSATGYTSGGNVMPMSANIGVRQGRLVIIFTASDNLLLPDGNDSHITVHIVGFAIRSGT